MPIKTGIHGAGMFALTEQVAVAPTQGFHYVTFNGASSYIDCGADASLADLQAGSFTVDLWINANPGLSDYIISKATAGYTLGWAIDGLPGGDILFEVIPSVPGYGYCTTKPPVRLPLGSWSHLAATYNIASRRCYVAIGGQWCSYLNNVASSGAIGTDAAVPLWIGRTAADPGWFPGSISWVRISSIVRWPIGVNFTPPARCKPPDMDGATVELWALDEGAGTVTAASVVAANAGAMTDCVWGAC